MYQDIPLSKVEEDMKVIAVQPELIMNKLSNIERYLLNQLLCFQPPQQQVRLRPSLLSTASKLPHPPPPYHHPELVSPTPVQIRASTPNQYPQQTSAGPSTSQELVLLGLPPATSQLKVKVSKKALPSRAIQESLDDINDVIARYPNLKGAKLPTLSMKLAKEAVFSKKIMEQCTPLQSRNLSGLPTAELNNLKEVLFRHSLYTMLGSIAELETVKSDCIELIGQVCKQLRTPKQQ